MADRVEEATNKVPVEVTEEENNEEEPSVVEKLDEVAADVSVPDPIVSEKQPEESDAINHTRTEMKSGEPMQVEIHEDSVSLLLKEAKDFGFSFVAFLLLVLFILAYGTLILEQLNR